MARLSGNSAVARRKRAALASIARRATRSGSPTIPATCHRCGFTYSGHGPWSRCPSCGRSFGA